MWVFDGEEWTEEGVTKKSEPTPMTPRFDEFQPELQIVEIVPVPENRTRYIPVPLP
jgi:hypothetical protein